MLFACRISFQWCFPTVIRRGATVAFQIAGEDTLRSWMKLQTLPGSIKSTSLICGGNHQHVIVLEALVGSNISLRGCDINHRSSRITGSRNKFRSCFLSARQHFTYRRFGKPVSPESNTGSRPDPALFGGLTRTSILPGEFTRCAASSTFPFASKPTLFLKIAFVKTPASQAASIDY